VRVVNPSPKSTLVADLRFALLLAVGVFFVCEFSVRWAGLQPADDAVDPKGASFAGLCRDPLLGPRPRPNYVGPWYGDFPVAIDERGFRAARFEAGEEGELRVAFLGDSCTFGWGLATRETFVAGLAELAARQGLPIDPLNAGFPGDSAVVGPHLLREQVLRHEPDVVVIGYSGNNAFRFTAVTDVARYRFAYLRGLLLRSRLIGLLVGAIGAPTAPETHPRAWEAFENTPLASWRRVASVAEFEEAMREMVELVRGANAEVILLLFPRASQVSNAYRWEDPAMSWRESPIAPSSAHGEVTRRDANLLLYSCPQGTDGGDPLDALRSRVDAWQAFYPGMRPIVLEFLTAGARDYVGGQLDLSRRHLLRALANAPEAPLALYSLASVDFARGRAEAGLKLLERSERASCNVFLSYQVALWRVAVDLRVPVVDLMLHFQAHDAERLFLDPAHPSAEARDVIAAALWPALSELVRARRARGDAN
jgi:lysophospholipase L1-like esterase